ALTEKKGRRGRESGYSTSIADLELKDVAHQLRGIGLADRIRTRHEGARDERVEEYDDDQPDDANRQIQQDAGQAGPLSGHRRGRITPTQIETARPSGRAASSSDATISIADPRS